METQTILESCQKILCNNKIYKDIDFFKVIRAVSKKSYADIGKEYKKSWFSIYSSIKDCNKNGLRSFTNKVIDLVKEDLK